MSVVTLRGLSVDSLRTIYIDFRNKTKGLSGCDYSNVDFNNEVYNIIKEQELPPTPANVVSCANDVYNNAVLRDWHATEKDVS